MPLNDFEARRAEIEVLAREFFAQNHDHVVAAIHCGRLLLSTEVPEKCGTCQSIIDEHAIIRMDEENRFLISIRS